MQETCRNILGERGGVSPMALTLSILWERLVFGMRFALGEDILQITAKMSGPSHGICSKSVDR
jgi:hypothetical protein